MILKNLLLGLLSWAIPFVISIFFFKPGGQLMVPYELFKSIMVVVVASSGSYLLFLYLKTAESDFIWHGIIVGLSWLAINLVLDSFILIPMMKSSFSNYFSSIGLHYLVFPAISLSMAYLLKAKTKQL